MKHALTALFLVAALALSGCNSPTVDGTSKETAKTSIEAMKSSLEASDQRALDKALREIDAYGKSSEYLSSIDGKSFEDLVTLAETLKAEHAARMKERDMARIAELEAKQEAFEATLERYAAFAFEDPKLSYASGMFGRNAVITATATNGTDTPIYAMEVGYTVSANGKTLDEGSVRQTVRGGFAPGVTQTLEIDLSPLVTLSKMTPPKDAVVSLKTLRLYRADGSPLVDAPEFTDADQVTLESLRSKYENL